MCLTDAGWESLLHTNQHKLKKTEKYLKNIYIENVTSNILPEKYV